jgi:hypothetical protein
VTGKKKIKHGASTTFVTTGERIFVGVFKLVMTRRIVSLSRGRRITVIGMNKYIEY